MAKAKKVREEGSVGHNDIGLNYLWHLQAIGLIESDTLQPTPDWQLDSEPEDGRARVAIIDNGATQSHPNLDSGRMILRVDFANWALGALYERPASSGRVSNEPDIAQEVDQFLGDASKFFGVGDDQTDKADVGIPDPPEVGIPIQIPLPMPGVPIGIPVPLPGPYKLDIEDPSDRFAAHATACAGLVGASAKPEGTEKKGDTDTFKNPHAIRYSGVDPDADIIPINTAYSHDYLGLIFALLYARSVSASVILLPRAVEEMVDHPCDADADPAEDPFAQGWMERPPDSVDDPRFTRLSTDPRRKKLKELFESLLSAVSNEIPVVVPAGNGGPGTLEYPARLTTGMPPKCPKLIVVGAATAFGKKSSYSATPDPEKSDEAKTMRLIYAPSDDREEITQDFVRYDELAWRARKLPIKQVAGKDKDFCPYKILAIDIPGPYGYSITSEDVGDLDEPGSSVDASSAQGSTMVDQVPNQPISIYTLFGGTSAAASIVAGTISRMCTLAKRSIPPDEVWEILYETRMESAPDIRKLFGDETNLPSGDGPLPFLNARGAISKIVST